MVKLVRDLTSCYEDVLTIHAEGSLEAQKMSILQLADFARYSGGHARGRHRRREEAPALCRAAAVPTGAVGGSIRRPETRSLKDASDETSGPRAFPGRAGLRRGPRRRGGRARARAVAVGRPALDEWESKSLLAAYGIPVPEGALVESEAKPRWPRPSGWAAGWP